MGRREQPEIKQGILEACTDYALAHGLPNHLEPLATAAGTSVRMLIYHFGTRDSLLRAVLGQARRRQVEAFRQLLAVRPHEPYPVTLLQAWAGLTGPDSQPYLRMFGRLHASAGEPLWPDFRRIATTDWLAPLEEGMASMSRPELATVVLAVIRGLLMDLDATGDRARTDHAFAAFLDAVVTASKTVGA